MHGEHLAHAIFRTVSLFITFLPESKDAVAVQNSSTVQMPASAGWLLARDE